MTQNPTALNRPTPTIEDYLTIIYKMQRDCEEVIAARLADSLGVTPPTVTVTLKRMERDGWITVEGRKGIALTETGLEAARTVMRRHILTEWLLARMLGMPWSHVHVEAHKIEHAISGEIEERMAITLDNPLVCPHGNPLPGYEHLIAGWLPLTGMQDGAQVIMRRVHETGEANPELLHYLEDNQIVPGQQVSVLTNIPFNQTITLSVKGREVALGYSTARYVYVEVISQS